MTRAQGESFEVGGWCFVIPASMRTLSSDARENLVENVVAALNGQRGAPFRRSRHATTWKVGSAGSSGEAVTIYLKQLDAARGLIALAKALSRTPRSAHVLRISEDLRRLNFGVPDVLLIGENRESGNQVIVMSEAPGFMLTRWMNPSHQVNLKLRRAILHRVGAEVARLHRSCYIHGDLTPYNVFAADDPQIAVTFIDHEGTEKTSRLSINVARDKLRNLVQLGHFDIPGVSRTDRLRVFASYAAASGLSPRAGRQALHRLEKMIQRRRARDHSIKRTATQPAIIAREGAARG